jgi:hypothetical protein
MKTPIRSLSDLTDNEACLIECALAFHAERIKKEGQTAFRNGDLYMVGESAQRLSTIQDIVKRLPVKI